MIGISTWRVPRVPNAPGLAIGLGMLAAACGGDADPIPVAAGPPPTVQAPQNPPQADVPTLTATSTPDVAAIYIVKRGDTATAIAANFGISLADLARVNGQTEEELDYLQIGQELKIPR